ncbi:MAG: diguanylate cyclase [Clostridia bacterium]|nr:diguanylate cyclase [Clostridia bacterium]
MSNSRRSTILLIDSDYTLTEKLANRLSSVGFNILTANTPEMASKLALISRPDIILLDILMKNKKGQDMLVVIKSNKATFNIPVIVLTSAVDIESKVYGFLSGANDYIIKPFSFEEVLARINTQLRILSMQKELEEKNRELTEKNEILQQIAITDGLTGLYNKSYIISRASNEILRASRFKEMISFIMIDIDHFKKINDTYGHLTGDLVLKEVSKQLKNSVRDIDILARYGGEEFLVICPNTDTKGAKVLAERIRRNVERISLKLNSDSINITASIGVKNAVPTQPAKPEQLALCFIGDADIALYAAKANGRNRVEFYDNSVSPVHVCNETTVADITVSDPQAGDNYTH